MQHAKDNEDKDEEMEGLRANMQKKVHILHYISYCIIHHADAEKYRRTFYYNVIV